MISRAEELMDLAKLIAEGDGHFSPLECREAVKYLLSLAEWRPIATAPKDGTAVFLFDGERRSIAMWRPAIQAWWWLLHFDLDATKNVAFPILWLPLPTPPTSKEQA